MQATSRARQRGCAASIFPRPQALVACVLVHRDVACILPLGYRTRSALLAAGMGKPLGVRVDVARTLVDSVQRDADRTRNPHVAVRRGSLLPGRRPRAAFRYHAGAGRSPTTQGLLVLVCTLMMRLSGAPVAFGLGALAVLLIVVFHGL